MMIKENSLPTSRGEASTNPERIPIRKTLKREKKCEGPSAGTASEFRENPAVYTEICHRLH